MKEELYLTKQAQQFREYEDLCRRCGACCGVYDGDACTNLIEQEDGKFFCKVYDRRWGKQTSRSGKVFTCVPIRELRQFDLPYLQCPYTK